MQQLPVFFQVQQQPCLVVGGGSVAERKIDLLRRAGAAVVVVSPELCADLQQLHAEKKIEYHARPFEVADIANKVLVIAATDNEQVNQAVATAAKERNIPVNVVDSPELCTFTFGSIVDRDPITIAVSSAGRSPVLARALKTRLESDIPAAFGKLAAFAGSYRDKVKSMLPDTQARRKFWEWILHGPIAELIFAGREQAAEQMMAETLQQGGPAQQRGAVYLIGAGPGDPDLLTFRALRLLQKADVIFYDRLISQEVMDFARRDAERFYVGKQRDNHCVPQSQINELLVNYAKQGKTVVRLKGGDPFIFGRGGEEAAALAENGIDFQVVPGITSASGCSAYAGIPLTHRDYAQSCRFLTGHTRDGELKLEWSKLANEQETLVFYMSVKNLATICAKLVEHGLPAAYPVAVIQHGTTAQQHVVVGTLADIPAKAAEEAVASPALIVIGRVVELRDKLAWFKTQT